MTGVVAYAFRNELLIYKADVEEVVVGVWRRGGVRRQPSVGHCRQNKHISGTTFMRFVLGNYAVNYGELKMYSQRSQEGNGSTANAIH